MEEDKYRTVNAIAEGLYKEKGSRFISFIYPVKSEEEIKDIVTRLKTKFYDARHHCYAYCLGANRERFRANDDGFKPIKKLLPMRSIMQRSWSER